MSDTKTPAPDLAQAPKQSPSDQTTPVEQKEIGGGKGPEPTRYGDWEVGGICTDF